MGSIENHADWLICSPSEQKAILLLINGDFSGIIGSGLARLLPDASLFDGRLGDDLTDFDTYADSVGFEL